ncbi:hypothetical protein TNCT6_73240 [Streptomyces sp. 6-11-2]|nr:hypothetical protein TNCT6_73240 [Streptomyces sp. 6-11-2]
MTTAAATTAVDATSSAIPIGSVPSPVRRRTAAPPGGLSPVGYDHHSLPCPTCHGFGRVRPIHRTAGPSRPAVRTPVAPLARRTTQRAARCAQRINEGDR